MTRWEAPVVGRAAPGGTGDGEHTRRNILDASIDVLRGHGAAAWSVPKVAELVGIQQGTVTHYYPTRRALLVATSEHIAALYASLVADRMAEVDTSDAAWAEDLIGWLLDDAIVPPTVELFPELWSLARTDPGIAAAVSGIYASAARELVRTLGHDPDDPGGAELYAVVWVLAATVEGMTAVHGHRTLDDPIFRAVRTEAVTLLAPRLHAAHRSSSG
jgi:AcrR family transcriptional regulator